MKSKNSSKTVEIRSMGSAVSGTKRNKGNGRKGASEGNEATKSLMVRMVIGASMGRRVARPVAWRRRRTARRARGTRSLRFLTDLGGGIQQATAKTTAGGWLTGDRSKSQCGLRGSLNLTNLTGVCFLCGWQSFDG